MREGVAISGKAGAGKDTFARILGYELTRREIWSQRVGFADALKEEVMEKFGLTKADPGGRAKLIEYSNAARDRDPLHWVKRLAQACDSLSSFGLVPLVSDLRYENEMKWAAGRGFITVRLDATMMDRAVVLATRGEDVALAESDHACETDLDDAEFDVRFWNPHGDHGTAMRHYAVRVADMLQGYEVEVEASNPWAATG